MGSGNEDKWNRKFSDESSSEENQLMRICVDCGASKTPVWRGGPSGPKTLCNACGIRNRKKRMGHLSIGKTKSSKKNNNNSYDSIKLRDSLKRRLIEMGSEVLMQRSMIEKEMRKLGEEEQAALLLMALSCGSIYA